MKGAGRLTQIWVHWCQASMSPQHSPRPSILSKVTFSGSLSTGLRHGNILASQIHSVLPAPRFQTSHWNFKISANHSYPNQNAPLASRSVGFLLNCRCGPLTIGGAFISTRLTSSGRVITFGISFCLSYKSLEFRPKKPRPRMNVLQTSLSVRRPSGLGREGGAVCGDMIFSSALCLWSQGSGPPPASWREDYGVF